MKYDLENILVDCLRNTLNVMLCTDSSNANQAVERLIRRVPVYNLFVAKSSARGAQLIQQVRSWNAIVIGPNCSFEDECIAWASDHPRWVPVIKLTDPLCFATPGATKRNTAAASWQGIDGTGQDVEENEDHSADAITTCSTDNIRKVLSLIQMKAIQNRLLTGMPTGIARLAMEVLFRENPLTVDEWSTSMGISPRKFQRELKDFTALTPKKIVALYHAYRIAFDTVEDRKQAQMGVVPAYVMDSQARNRVMEYVLTRRSTLFSSAR